MRTHKWLYYSGLELLSWDNSPKPRIFDPLVYSYNRIKIIISINFSVICGDIFLFQIPKYLTILLATLKKIKFETERM